MKSSKILSIALFASLAPLSMAQVAVSGAKVLDAEGKPLVAGKWSFGPYLSPVKNGAFQGTLPAAANALAASETDAVIVVNKAKIPMLIVTNVALPQASNWNWDEYVVTSKNLYSGYGTPYLRCEAGASYLNRSDFSNWKCVAKAGKTLWVNKGALAKDTAPQATKASDNGKALSLNFSVALAAKDGSQGLVVTKDFYYVGRNDGLMKPGTALQYKPNGELANSFMIPSHGNDGDIRLDRGTMLWSTGGATTPAQVWETDLNGKKLRSWNFANVDYGTGAAVAYYKPSHILLFTSDASSDFKLRDVTINDNGTFKLGKVWSSKQIKLPQSPKWKDGYLWMTMGYKNDSWLYKLTLNKNGSVSIIGSQNLHVKEPEGLSFVGNEIYFLDNASVIRKATF